MGDAGEEKLCVCVGGVYFPIPWNVYSPVWIYFKYGSFSSMNGHIFAFCQCTYSIIFSSFFVDNFVTESSEKMSSLSDGLPQQMWQEDSPRQGTG